MKVNDGTGAELLVGGDCVGGRSGAAVDEIRLQNQNTC